MLDGHCLSAAEQGSFGTGEVVDGSYQAVAHAPESRFFDGAAETGHSMAGTRLSHGAAPYGVAWLGTACPLPSRDCSAQERLLTAASKQWHTRRSRGFWMGQRKPVTRWLAHGSRTVQHRTGRHGWALLVRCRAGFVRHRREVVDGSFQAVAHAPESRFLDGAAETGHSMAGTGLSHGVAPYGVAWLGTACPLPSRVRSAQERGC